MYTIKIVRGNIVNVTTEAIVNPANNNLMPGGGANKMIFYAAGDKLIEECSTLKYCDTGKAVYTQGFNIPAKYIIHAVGPYWHGGYNNEAQDLASCYISIMKIAEQLNIKSLAIPALCTGLGGYPLDEAIDIAVSSVVSYLQSHQLDMEIWFMCYDQETLLRYRAKNMDGVNDVAQYFNRQTINLKSPLNKNEKKLLKKKLFKKEITKEQEEQALTSFLKRILKKKYPDVVFLPPPKKNSNITMKTCTKYERSGPFVTMECVEEYSYTNEKMKVKIKPFSFLDTPEELESKKKYFIDDNDNVIPDQFEGGNQSSYNQAQKVLKVANIESMLSGINHGEGINVEYVDVEKTNVKIEDISEARDELTRVALENTDVSSVQIAQDAEIINDQYVSDDASSYVEETPYTEEFSETVNEETTIEEPTFEEPTFEEPAIEESAIEETMFEEPTIEEPVIEKPVIEETMVEEPTIEEPAVEELAIAEPMIEESTLEEPAVIEEQEIITEVEENIEVEKVEEITEENTNYPLVEDVQEEPTYTETNEYDADDYDLHSDFIEETNEVEEVVEENNEIVMENVEEDIEDDIPEDIEDTTSDIIEDSEKNKARVFEEQATVEIPLNTENANKVEKVENTSPKSTNSTKNKTSPNKNKNQYKKSKKDYRPDYSKYKNKGKNKQSNANNNKKK